MKHIQKKLLITSMSIASLTMLAGCSDMNLNSSHSNKANSTNPPPTKVVSSMVLGPVQGANILIEDSRNQQAIGIKTALTNDKGEFLLSALDEIKDENYYIVKASKGNWLDSDGDGVKDGVHSSQGDLVTFVTGKQIKNSAIKISLLTDIAYRFTKENLADLSNQDITRRLSDIANVFFLKDITGDKVIDANDIHQFDPTNKAHQEALSIEYKYLFKTPNNTPALMSAYLAGDDSLINNTLDSLFGNKMSRFETKDSRSQQVKIEVLPFGKGNVTSTDNFIQYKSDGSITNTTHFYDKSDNMITFIATPDADTQILGWNGCEIISEDLTQCQVRADNDHQIIPSFGYKDAQIVSNVVDLSRASVSTEGESTVYVTVNYEDEELMQQMQNLKPNDYIVGETEEFGILRKIISVTKVSDYKYTLETVEASLEEVILQGTVHSSSTITNQDIPEELFTENHINPSNINKTPATLLEKPSQRFSNIDGVNLVKPADLNSKDIIIEIGKSSKLPQADRYKSTMPRPDNFGITGEIENAEPIIIKDPKTGVEVKIKGKVKVNLDLDVGLSYEWNRGLQSFQIIPNATFNEELDIYFGGEADTNKLCKHLNKDDDCIKMKIGTLPIKKQVVMLGWFPVYIDVFVDIYVGLDGKVSLKLGNKVELEQKLKMGMLWNSNIGFKPVGEFEHTEKFSLYDDYVYAGLSAEARGYIVPGFNIKLYSLTGPVIEPKGFAKVKAEVNWKEAKNDNPDSGTFSLWKAGSKECKGGVDVKGYVGLEVAGEWQFGPSDANANKISRKLNEIFPKAKISLIPEKEWAVYEQNFGGECSEAKAIPKLELNGGHIIEKSPASTDLLVKTYTLKNTGGFDLKWKADYRKDGVVSVSKAEGTLKPNAQETVTVTIDKSKLKVGYYSNQISFTNQTNRILAWADHITGSTKRNIKLTIIPNSLPSPTNVKVALFKPTIAKLTWEYPTHDTNAKYVKGYRVYRKEQGKDWEIYTTINNPSQKLVLIPNLLTNSTYQFAVDAFTDGQSSKPPVNVSLQVPSTKPKGDCQAFFTGLVVGGAYDSAGISEANLLDDYSEYVGAGLYPDNTQAFPKAVRSTFDGIAIGKGTKVTIYSEKNFKGNVLYEQVGPAIVNNRRWMNDNRYAPPAMGVWKEPLQSQFPLSVRKWSQTDMHDWSYGSLKIECGF